MQILYWSLGIFLGRYILANIIMLFRMMWRPSQIPEKSDIVVFNCKPLKGDNEPDPALIPDLRWAVQCADVRDVPLAICGGKTRKFPQTEAEVYENEAKRIAKENGWEIETIPIKDGYTTLQVHQLYRNEIWIKRGHNVIESVCRRWQMARLADTLGATNIFLLAFLYPLSFWRKKRMFKGYKFYISSSMTDPLQHIPIELIQWNASTLPRWIQEFILRVGRTKSGS